MIRLTLPHQSQPKLVRYFLRTLYVFVIFAVALILSNPPTSYSSPPYRETATVKDPLDTVKAFVTFLAAEEQYFKTHKPSEADLDKLHNMRSLFSSLPEEIDNARKNQKLSVDELAYLKKIESRLSSLQQRTLPGLRLAMKKQAQKTLWEQDITVSVAGAGNTTIVFVGYHFAANANIQQVQDELESLLLQLRFKVSRYQWQEGSKGWQYELKTPPDAAIRMFKFNQFVEVTK